MIGLDPGERRIGVAISDPTGRLALPHGVLDRRRHDVIAELIDLCARHDVERIVIGLPLSLSGHEGPQARAARTFGEWIESEVDMPVEYWDERFTSLTAERALIEGRVRRERRRDVRDKVAATVMLQGYLDAEARRPQPGPDAAGAPPAGDPRGNDATECS